MRKQIDNQLEELNMQDQVQHNNVELLLPKLRAKGLAVCITDTLRQPDTVGQVPFSYPISLWNPSTPTQPTTPTPSPNPVILSMNLSEIQASNGVML